MEIVISVFKCKPYRMCLITIYAKTLIFDCVIFYILKFITIKIYKFHTFQKVIYRNFELCLFLHVDIKYLI